ncbi:hypothetical protein SK128_023209 [Halocaridina rubra]|uniref:CCHC-type domain-containing protein n=1 Tax=Halocaridina rubra TaxID=373956 RepID=A0AAN8WVC3_HALRR
MEWKLADVVPIFKKGERVKKNNYRPTAENGYNFNFAQTTGHAAKCVTGGSSTAFGWTSYPGFSSSESSNPTWYSRMETRLEDESQSLRSRPTTALPPASPGEEKLQQLYSRRQPCSNCGEINHDLSHCWFNYRLKCGHCREHGHKTRLCPLNI